jgi:DNA modification methylase
VTLSAYWADGDRCQLFLGDCREVMAQLEPESFDAVVTDPPYGLEFMGAEWDSFGRDTGNGYKEKPRFTNGLRDKGFGELPNHFEAGRPYQQWCLQWATECMRVLKPGGYLLAFGGTRTYHRLACAIEDAGFEIRDSIDWIYGSGFPKGLDVGKAIDKAAGAQREVTGEGQAFGRGSMRNRSRVEMGYRPTELNPDGGISQITAPATEAARRWDGWNVALKPAHEPIVMARKPLAGTVAQNVLAYGTGALNIDPCRVGHRDERSLNRNESIGYGGSEAQGAVTDGGMGRWPPNVLLTHSPACIPLGTRKVKAVTGTSAGDPDGKGIYGTAFPRGDSRPTGKGDADGTETVEAWDCAPGCPVAELDRQSGATTSTQARHAKIMQRQDNEVYGQGLGSVTPGNTYTDSGGASRYFPVFRYEAKAGPGERPRGKDGTAHPTVKPVDLMAWLVRLVSRRDALILDPFAGSGTTGEACVVEGRRCVLIEREPKFAALTKARLAKPIQPGMF